MAQSARWRVRNHRRAQALQAEKSPKEQSQKLKKRYITYIRKTRDTGGEVMVEKIHIIHKDDAERRPQLYDDRPRNITELQGRSGLPDQRFIHLGTGRVSNNGNDKNR